MFGGGCYDFDVNADELFDAASSIVVELENNVDETEHETVIVSAKQNLLRLLHVFILPKLPLQTCDLGSIRTVLSLVEDEQKDVKTKTANKDRLRKSAEKSLEKQMLDLLKHHDFSSLRSVASCNYEFLKEFLNQLERDIATSNDIMLEFETEISPLRSCTSENDLQKLNSLRNKREKALTRLNDSVIARETIKNVISRHHVDKKYLSRESSVHPDHMVFMETACRFENVNDEIKGLTTVMNKLTSVKEAALDVKGEIEEKGESCGHFVSKSDFKFHPKTETDEWNSLSEKIDSLISAKPLGFKNKHKKFCKKIMSKCQKLFNSSKSHSSCGLESSEKSCDLERSLSLSPDVLHNYGNKPNSALQGICGEVIKHISGMTEMFAEELYKKPASDVRQSVLENIYICYESHVSRELMPILHQLYENSYKQQCESLCRWISQKSLSQTLIAKVDPSLSDLDSIVVTAEASESESYPGFETFEALMKTETETMSVFTKLKHVMEVVQHVEKTARGDGEKPNLVCTDDILDTIILFLQKLDSDTLLKTYAHINLIRHLSPDFVEGNCHEYALISFYAAYQHLFDQHVLEKISRKNEGIYSKIS